MFQRWFFILYIQALQELRNRYRKAKSDKQDDLQKIILRSSQLLNITINDNSAAEIAKRSRGTPRIANRILKRSRDFAEISNKGTISIDIANETLSRLGIDDNGLDDMDRRILQSLVETFNGGPVGLESLAVAIVITIDIRLVF